jgi:CDP-diacylglycerol--glycerol-3-phosphate 3-phosphatidyltransferase
MWLSKYGRQFMARPVGAVVNWLNRHGVSPNAVSYVGLAITIVSAVVIAAGAFIVGALLLLFASLLDLVDGSLARATGQSTTWGAFLDSTLDRYSESITFLGLAFYYSYLPDANLEIVLIFLTVVGSFMVSYTRARAEALNVECKEGWMQRPERIALLIVGLLFGQMFPLFLTIVLALMAILTNFTAMQRIYQVYWRIQLQEQASLPQPSSTVQNAPVPPTVPIPKDKAPVHPYPESP